MTLKNIIRQWQYRRFRKHLFDDRFYQPLLSCKHKIWGDGTIGLGHLLIDAHTNHVITDHDVCVAYVNIGEDIKYL